VWIFCRPRTHPCVRGQRVIWWAEHDVAARGKGTKKLRHPVVGELTLDRDTLTCATDPEQHIIVWTAAPGSPSHVA
jgi:hypothetical protein